jgi:hypothetical protein
MQEDSAFLDFVGALCKSSLEMVNMQSGVDIDASAGTGVSWMWKRILFQVRARVLPASSLPARNGLAGGGLVGTILRGRWCVMSPCLCLLQLRKWSEQRSGDFGITRLAGVAALNIQCLAYRPSDFAWTRSLHTSSSFSVTPQCRLPSALRTIHLNGDYKDNQSLNNFLHRCHWKRIATAI